MTLAGIFAALLTLWLMGILTAFTVMLWRMMTQLARE
jgi:hypothetical protein